VTGDTNRAVHSQSNAHLTKSNLSSFRQVATLFNVFLFDRQAKQDWHRATYVLANSLNASVSRRDDKRARDSARISGCDVSHICRTGFRSPSLDEKRVKRGTPISSSLSTNSPSPGSVVR